MKNRIKELRMVLASELVENPKNWRTHSQAQADALGETLTDVGIATAVIARELPDGRLELIDGHLRAGVMEDEEIPVLVLDVTAAEAEKLLATMDPLAAMADTDAHALDSLLAEIDIEGEAINRMLTSLAGSEGLFAVAMDPATSASSVTAGDLEKSAAEMQDHYKDQPRDLLEITCPHCGGDFNIDKP